MQDDDSILIHKRTRKFLILPETASTLSLFWIYEMTLLLILILGQTFRIDIVGWNLRIDRLDKKWECEKIATRKCVSSIVKIIFITVSGQYQSFLERVWNISTMFIPYTNYIKTDGKRSCSILVIIKMVIFGFVATYKQSVNLLLKNILNSIK